MQFVPSLSLSFSIFPSVYYFLSCLSHLRSVTLSLSRVWLYSSLNVLSDPVAHSLLFVVFYSMRVIKLRL
ncbi:hypothetical protein CROQUDRAFT_408990 [Cronartium quercuum f. sp. fusiforme G11]|uniref:Uncharacterized protein n=1 Tax=Cronartium quercuum f. sp. fusiforme G11 TaxID=708437 RepID=A0A9P6NRS3_9BASI|nr:hypothetical protein CROQUDRAFT_408990 [Cronartium quercuum f. sp. fusiforme G11]